MQQQAETRGGVPSVVVTENAEGLGPFVFLCDHASNVLPAEFGGLGLDEAARRAHIAWDPGALGVSRHLSALFDAPLVYPDLSRLVLDCNRDPAAADLIPEVSETTEVPGNRGLSPADRQARIDLVHTPFHRTITELLDARAEAGLPTAVVSIHSFTPIYKGVSRPWPIGILSDTDRRLAEPILTALAADPATMPGDNVPYSPADGVYYTVGRHGEGRGLPCVMIEIRNDEVASPEAEALWAERLGDALAFALENLTAPGQPEGGHA
ncbi:N-formylglutamate amidohydrolase [Stappia taiwanensis]|uniref:N-formylglutamate amidohydrolase n=1 Tax=Stappia taiwanensis TaxID=992267 RepID=A0A838XYE0_9HYPH|nr:N-formylglutamate amidohydrolase [Stappia taiwanensis]MBA4611893.1 N-formylglutamate amidohydrolase [Stappia taiwanensis]GGF03605.1 N-formylglutamate amidohydrolase [Stappia taiwanensis]